MATLTVTNLNDSGAGSLRAAITTANAGVPGALNTIAFSVSGTITLASDLPAITGLTNIVAASATIGNAPTVGINFNGHAGLTFAAGSEGSQLIGLSLGGATGNGVTLDAGNIILNNNTIGLALDGSALGNTGDGVFVAATSSGNNIGYNPAALSDVVSNVISSNGGNGISFHGSTGNTVVSNRIGTDLTGTTAMANGANGIWVTAGSNGNLIGGTADTDSSSGAVNNPTGDKGTKPAVFVTPPLGNLVSGNALNGILIDTGSQNNVLNGNFVGTTAGGNTALGNGSDGVAINGADNNSLIGCTVTDEPFVYYNVVSGNGANGIHITNADNTTVQANFVGVGANNAVMVGNANDGILVDGSSQNTQVGGVIPLGNVISGNALNGIEVADTASDFITFNTFGGVYAFAGAAPNGNDGVLITSTGGGNVVRTNVLSGNTNNGLEIGGNASGVLVVPNIMGLDTVGARIVANGGNGVLITGTAHDNILGGEGGDQVSVIVQNTFSGNDLYGVAITGQAYNNTVINSAIGTDILEVGALGNGAGGVLISSTGIGNVIGTAVVGWTPVPSPAALVNVISGNNGNGVTLAAGANADAILNNWIGLDITGAATLPNTGVPIQTNANHNLIYGNEATGSLPIDSPTAQLEALYIGWFGWAADPGSFATRMQTYLTDVLNGASVTDAALSLSVGFSTAPELAPYAALAALVPPVTSPTPGQIALANSFIDQTFTNLFGHAASTADKLAWRTELFSGTVPFSAMVYDIANTAAGSDVTAVNSKIEAASYFTTAAGTGLPNPPSLSQMQAAIAGVVDTTSTLASEAATDAVVGGGHNQVTYATILGAGDVTTGVRAGLDGSVVLTGDQLTGAGGATVAFLYEGPLNNTAAGTKYIVTPTFAGETITTATFYGPDTSIFDPALGIGNVRAVGSYQYSESPAGVLNHGMMYQGPITGIGGAWTQIDVPTNGVNVVGGIVIGGTVEDTILHSTQGDLVVGNYDLSGPGGSLLGANGFIYNVATQQYTLMSINGKVDNLTSLYGIWQNGIGSTSYTLAGGTYVAGDGINEGFLEKYDSSTGIFSDLTFYTGYNLPGVITHFENISAVPGGFNLVATTTTGPAFASVTLNADGSFGEASWVPIALPGSSLLTGNIAYQNVIGGIYNTTDAGTPSTYLGVVDQSHVTAAGGRIMPMGSYNFAYALTVQGSVGDTVSGSTTAGNVLGGSIGNDTFAGTLSGTEADTIFTGGGADTITLVAGHSVQDRIELFAANGLSNAANLTPGGVVASVFGSIVDASDIPQLGWWGQATAQFGGPVSNAATNAGVGTGTSQDMSTVTNFVTGSSAEPVDTIDISLGAFSNLLRNLGTGTAPFLGTAIFSNMVHPGGTVTVANADVLLIDSPTGFANAAAVAAALVATPITFAGSQTAPLNHYIIAYQDLGGNVRIADMDIHASGAFTTTAQGQTISISDMVQLSGVSLASLHPGNITFLSGSGDPLGNVIVGTAASETLTGTSGVDDISGLAGDDRIFGLAGNDTLDGDAGDDTLNGNAGADIMAGGIGNDAYYVDNGGDQVIEAVGQGTDNVYSTVSYTLAAGQEIESLRVYGTTAGLTLTGNEFANYLVGGSGNDTLNGGGGDDTLNGNAGADMMTGGTGNDAYYVDNGGDQVIEAVGQGTDNVYSTVSYTLAAGQEIESLRAYGAGATSGVTLIGNEFANALVGGGGNDVLDGGAASDTLVGGTGNDVFRFSTTLGSSNVDTIADFGTGGDSIQLDQTVFAGLALGQLSASAFALDSATGADPQIVYNHTTGALFFDSNGAAAGGSTQFASVTGAPGLDASYFRVI